MKIDHIHFYVEDAKALCNWFVRTLGFQLVASGENDHTCTEAIASGSVCFVLSSPLTSTSPVAQFLRRHPSGVADIAFLVQDVEASMDRAVRAGAKVLQPMQQQQQAGGWVKWGTIAAWGSLTHTLIETTGDASFVRSQKALKVDKLDIVGSNIQSANLAQDNDLFTEIDHVVLNVAAGDLERVVTWYENTLGFIPQQTFAIQTERSALYSTVMVHPDGYVKLPVNEPASANSQIQEFLDVNKGPGIQHIALQTVNIVQAIALLRQRGLLFLPVPSTYYTQLRQRSLLQMEEAEFQEIAREQILVDWQDDKPQSLLLQIFTQPIFGQPTFFFELIERRLQAPGFGEGNFRALFEAIEREQLKRGSLGVN